MNLFLQKVAQGSNECVVCMLKKGAKTVFLKNSVLVRTSVVINVGNDHNNCTYSSILCVFWPNVVLLKVVKREFY